MAKHRDSTTYRHKTKGNKQDVHKQTQNKQTEEYLITYGTL